MLWVMESDITHSHQNVVSIWVADDHKDFREALQDILNNTEEMRCDRIFSSCEEMLEEIMYEVSPDILLLDINFPHSMSGIEGVSLLRVRAPDVRVIMLSMHLEDDIIFDALKAGAHGFVFKMSVPAKILKSIKSVHAGMFDVSPQIAQRMLDILHPDSSTPERKTILIRQEIEVLIAFMQGASEHDIAKHLRISMPKLESLIQSIYRKLHQV